jgi:hypothetical protein
VGAAGIEPATPAMSTAGVVTVVEAWMLDPVACAGMEVGAPRVTVIDLLTYSSMVSEDGNWSEFRNRFL